VAQLAAVAVMTMLPVTGPEVIMLDDTPLESPQAVVTNNPQTRTKIRIPER
jgi:hypothetical protein